MRFYQPSAPLRGKGRGGLRALTLALALASLHALPSRAEDVQAAPAAPSAEAANSGNTAWTSGYLFDFSTFGEESGLAQRMADAGLYLNGGETGILAGTVGGGEGRGAVFDNDFLLEVDLDLNRILGIPGAAMHIAIDDRVGGNLAKFTGDTLIVPQTFGPNEVLQFQELDWDQSLFDGHVLLLIGRQSPVMDYDALPVGCNFVFTNNCANPTPFASMNDGPPIAPASTYGARMSIHPTEATYLRFGVYEDNPNAESQLSNLGDNWGFRYATGAFVPVELGYKTGFVSDPYPRLYAVGFFHDSSPFPDPLLTTAQGTPVLDQGRNWVYALVQQMIWRPDLSETRRGLILFGDVMFGSGEAQIHDFYQGGFSWQGPLASHPHDSLNFLVQYQVLDQRLAYAETLAANQAGVPGRVTPGETDLELNYLWQAGAGVSFQPFVEYMIHPDQIGFAVPSPRLPSALTLGTEIAIALPDSLGLPVFTRQN